MQGQPQGPGGQMQGTPQMQGQQFEQFKKPAVPPQQFQGRLCILMSCSTLEKLQGCSHRSGGIGHSNIP